MIYESLKAAYLSQRGSLLRSPGLLGIPGITGLVGPMKQMPSSFLASAKNPTGCSIQKAWGLSIYLSICLSIYLHYSTLQYITVHYIALHYITYKYIYILCIYMYIQLYVYHCLSKFGHCFFGNILPIPCWRDVFSLVLWF